MLSNCNTLSRTRLEKATRDFRAHIAFLTETRKDLDQVFKRIASLKQRLAAQNPEAFKGT